MAALLTAWGAASTPFALESRGASARVAYFGFVDTDLVRDAFDHLRDARLRDAPAAADAGRGGLDEKLTLASSSR